MALTIFHNFVQIGECGGGANFLNEVLQSTQYEHTAITHTLTLTHTHTHAHIQT
jgi:hypothetical protein